MDPLPDQIPLAKELGADRVELYTESWANAFQTATHVSTLGKFVESSKAAIKSGLGVNAGHDLNLENLTTFLKAVPGVREVSIGHALISDALEFGYSSTVKAYLDCIEAANSKDFQF